MNECATTPPSSTTCNLPPRLCRAVEGVEFWIAPSHGPPLRCVITEAALQGHYGANERAESWLSAFLLHRRNIERRAKLAAGRRTDVHVVLVSDSTGHLKASAGRCRS